MWLDPSSHREVFMTEALLVRAPFDDGLPVERSFVGCHARRRAAIRRVQACGVREKLETNDLYRVLVVEITGHLLGHGYGDSSERVWLTPAGDVLEEFHRIDEIEPWDGRDPSRCRWRVGDVVACVHRGSYRVGVVLAQPPSTTARSEQPRANLTNADDVYVVGFPGTVLEQCRPREAQMFAPLAPVDGELRSRLFALKETAERGNR